MARLPAEPQRGRPVSNTWGRDVVRYLRYLTPSGGAGIRVDKTGPNVRLSRAMGRAVPGSPNAGPPAPWTVTVRWEEGAAYAIITPGTLNDIIPGVGEDGTSMVETPRPELSLSDGHNDIYLKIVSDEQSQISELNVLAETPSQSDTSDPLTGGTKWILLASVDIDESEETADISQFRDAALQYRFFIDHTVWT